MDPRTTIVKPVVSEKSYGLMDRNAYTFVVHPDATKADVRHAVETVFGVRVSKVNTFNRKGKRKFNRMRRTWGARPTTKRAVVTLVGDDHIDLLGS